MAARTVCRPRRSRGVTLVELVITFVILAFISLGTIQLYRVGDQQQRVARLYSDAQSSAREGLRRIMRTARHASAAESNVTFTGLGAVSSGAAQLVVATPPAGGGAGTDHILFRLSGTTLYAQRSTESAPGTAIATGVQSVSFTYYQTTVTSTGTQVNDVTSSSPTSATEVNIALTMPVFNGQTTTRTAYVAMRNRSPGF